jgi:quercetin dioxygenase-like cupin family protein
MNNKTRGKGLVIAISIGVVLLCSARYTAPTTNILVEGTIPDSKVFGGPVQMIVRTLTIKPGEKLPFHYHPGHAFNVVKSGTLTVEDGCGGVKTLTPGQGFEEMDGRVHRGRNLTDKDVVVYDTFIIQQGKPTTVNIPMTNVAVGRHRMLRNARTTAGGSLLIRRASLTRSNARASSVTAEHNPASRKPVELSYRRADARRMPRVA